MESKLYRRQVSLLLNVIPEVAKETCFALHGGTAINLFIRDMPRLSIDIDLTYIPIEDRIVSLSNIGNALERIKKRIETVVPDALIIHREEVGKLQISAQGVTVKLEVNLINRGTLNAPTVRQICTKAQNDFNSFCAIQVVPTGQLYGGKICAALDRQHPRDLFDVKYLLKNEGFSKKVKKGFLMCLLSSARPINEIIYPHFLDQRSALENQFAGMTNEQFDYAEYEHIRIELLNIVHKNLSNEDKQFLLSVQSLTPDWDLYNFEQFPAIKWKIQNLHKLKNASPKKYKKQYETLEALLSNL